MKNFLGKFFMTLGVLFFGLILVAIYLFITDPFNLKPLLFSSNSVPVNLDTGVDTTLENESSTTSSTAAAPTTTDVNDKHPTLTAGQENALELIGIDPAVLPETLTPEQEACFVGKLGQQRVDEIKAGAAPSVTDMFKAGGCI